MSCDGLPLELESCNCCGFTPQFSRNLQRIHPSYIIQATKKNHRATDLKDFIRKCSCPPMCPICYPELLGEPGSFIGQSGTKHETIFSQAYGLMFVGKRDYTPRSFIREAERLGVCKRIPDVPKWLKLGETWVLLAHSEVPKVNLKHLKSNEMHMREPEKMKAIFYAFKPQRIEMPIFKGQLTDKELEQLKVRGVTPVLLDPTPENKKKHGKAKAKTLESLIKQKEIEIHEEIQKRVVENSVG